jgi:hypothetical protein
VLFRSFRLPFVNRRNINELQPSPMLAASVQQPVASIWKSLSVESCYGRRFTREERLRCGGRAVLRSSTIRQVQVTAISDSHVVAVLVAVLAYKLQLSARLCHDETVRGWVSPRGRSDATPVTRMAGLSLTLAQAGR